MPIKIVKVRNITNMTKMLGLKKQKLSWGTLTCFLS